MEGEKLLRRVIVLEAQAEIAKEAIWALIDILIEKKVVGKEELRKFVSLIEHSAFEGKFAEREEDGTDS